MEKIKILSDASNKKSPLAKSLKMLFPECDIQVITKNKTKVAGLKKVKKKDESEQRHEESAFG